jgi:hypothetical protein
MSSRPDENAPHAAQRAPAADPRRFQQAGDYIELPLGVAESHALYGIAGWTVVLAVFMVLDAIVFALSTIGSFMLAARGAGGWFSVLGLIQLGLLIWAIACIAKLFAKKPDFPSQFTALCVASATLTVFGMLIGGATWMAVIQLVVVALYIGYVQRSRRVRVTFRRQVESGDPILRATFPEGLPEHLRPGVSPWSAIGKMPAPGAPGVAAARRPF